MRPALVAWTRMGVALAILLALDQVLKAIVVASLDRGESESVFPGIGLTYVRNEGVAFGAFDDGGALIVVFTGIAMAGLVAWFALNTDKPWLWLPVGAVLGGALGNLADRARDGSVIDYLDPSFWPAFNLADVAIVAGVFCLVLIPDKREREP